MKSSILYIIKVSIIIAIGIEMINRLFGSWDTITYEKIIENLIIQFMFAFPLTLVNTYFYNFISEIYSWESQTQKRLWYGAFGAIILTMATIIIIRIILVVGYYGKPFEQFIQDEKLSYYLSGFVITLIVSLFFHAFFFFKELQKQKITEQKIIAGTASAKFAALKNQLDPHFLFNSLNVLTSLIEENPKMAQKFTTSLSKVYRYVLEQKNKELVTVDEELAFAKTYMTLLQLRFEESIVFEMPEKATNPEAKVVPLSLQILLENTIKHNVVMQTRPLHIKIFEKDNFLIVENNLQPKEVIKQSSGVGLGNIQQRYALLTKRKFSIYKTKDSFIAELPILTKKVMHTDIETLSDLKDEEQEKSMKYKRAKAQVKKMKEFYGNLLSFCVIIPFMVFVNYKDNGFSFPWVIFPIIGWGIGLTFHYMEAFNRHLFLGKDWEKRKINTYMSESKRKKHE